MLISVKIAIAAVQIPEKKSKSEDEHYTYTKTTFLNYVTVAPLNYCIHFTRSVPA